MGQMADRKAQKLKHKKQRATAVKAMKHRVKLHVKKSWKKTDSEIDGLLKDAKKTVKEVGSEEDLEVAEAAIHRERDDSRDDSDRNDDDEDFDDADSLLQISA